MKLGQYKEAEFEFKFFNRRKFKADSANTPFIRKSLFNHARALIQLERYPEALESLEKVLKAKPGNDQLTEADILIERGIARKNAGKNGFLSDWNQAKKLGSKQAERLLQEQ